MGADFDSFDASALGAFVQSALGARNGVPILGDLFVYHAVSSFNGVAGSLVFYDASAAEWKAASSGDAGFTPTSLSVFSELVISNDRLFCLTADDAGDYGVWCFDVINESWAFASGWPFANNFPAKTTNLKIVTEYPDGLILCVQRLTVDDNIDVYTVGDTPGVDSPEFSSPIVKFSFTTGLWSDISTGFSHPLSRVNSAITVGNNFVVNTETGYLVLNVAGSYTNCVDSDIDLPVVNEFSFEYRAGEGTISEGSPPTLFTITISGQTESYLYAGGPASSRDELISICNNSTQSNFKDKIFSAGVANIIEYETTPLDYFLNGVQTPVLSASGGTGFVSDFSIVSSTTIPISYAGTLKGFDNSSQTWWVIPDSDDDVFKYNGAITITGGTGAGDLDHDDNGAELYDYLIHTFNGSSWNTDETVRAEADPDGLFPNSTRLMKAGNNAVISSGDFTFNLVAGEVSANMFVLDLAGNAYPVFNVEILGDRRQWVEKGSSLYFIGHAVSPDLDGILKLDGTTLTQHSPNLGSSEDEGMECIEFRGDDLILGTNISKVGITPLSYNFYYLNESSWSQYLDSTGTGTNGGTVLLIKYAGEEGALFYGTFYVSGVSPSSGDEAGGETVTVSGVDFSASTTISFDGTPATSIIFINANTITCNTPAHSSGLVDVTATDGAKSNTLIDGYEYTADVSLSITSIDPTSGPNTGGTSVTITGTGFTGSTAVKFSTSSATSIVVVDPETITCVTPSIAPRTGPTDVIVEDESDSDSLINGYTYT